VIPLRGASDWRTLGCFVWTSGEKAGRSTRNS